MAQRSTGIFPREKFDLDALMEVGTVAADLPIDVTTLGTIRVVVLGGNLGTDDVTVTIGGKSVVFEAGDLDANGVGIAYLRGSLCADSEAVYAVSGTATVNSVYVDAVDNVG